MRATIRNYMDAVKRRREEGDEAGFSLIELIVVVVILGILAAIAIPVFVGLQGQAKDSAVQTATSNAVSQVSAKLSQGEEWDVAKSSVSSLEKDDIKLVVDGSKIDDICVSGYDAGAKTHVDPDSAFKSGPGCTTP